MFHFITFESGGYVPKQPIREQTAGKQFDHFGRRIQNIDAANESEYLGTVLLISVIRY